MELLYLIAEIIGPLAISFGVTCSTLAILSFFVAIHDGTIDQNERSMLGVIYILLRIAMVLILLSGIILGVRTGFVGNPENIAFWLLIAVLYLNATLMTLHLIPSSVGPALQAASWYTLGSITLLGVHGVHFVLQSFFWGYIAVFMLFLIVVNGYMRFFTVKKS